MFRRILVLLCVLSVVALGLQPAAAGAVSLIQQEHAMGAMHEHCACPPEHHATPATDENNCVPSLSCMIDCSIVPSVTAAEAASPLDAFPTEGALFAEIVAPPSSQSDPPFRPPSV